ncbi:MULTISPECIES: HNH endonuclease [Pseudomonas]|uniref:HNH endonuclease n=1 Tax=Pseudomonas TaxID=286 RepID=UPI0028A18374|nr:MULTISPECIES: HNH endonuclease [Pseudomonas]
MEKAYVELDISTKKYPGLTCRVDAEDVAKLSGYTWGIAYMGEHGFKLPYARTRIGGRKNPCYIRMHRLIMDAPKGIEVDHINGDTLDNRKCNLRFADRKQQSRNTGMRRNNTTGYKGVSKHKARYRAYITVDRRQIHLGLYKCPIEASRAYNEAALKFFGEFARINEEKSRKTPYK